MVLYACFQLLGFLLGLYWMGGRIADELIVQSLLLNALSIGVGLWLLSRPKAVMNFGFAAEEASDPEVRSGQVPDLAAGASFLAAYRDEGKELPLRGRVYLEARSLHQAWVVQRARFLVKLGYEVLSAGTTLQTLCDEAVPCGWLGDLPGGPKTMQAAMAAGEIQLVLITDNSRREIIEQAETHGIPCFKNREAIDHAIDALAALHEVVESQGEDD